MKISALIKRLEEIKAKEGDLDCFDVNLFDGPVLRVDSSKSYEHTDVTDLPEKFLLIGEDAWTIF